MGPQAGATYLLLRAYHVAAVVLMIAEHAKNRNLKCLFGPLEYSRLHINVTCKNKNIGIDY